MYIMTKDRPGAPGAKTGRNGSDPLGANTEIGRKLKQYYDELVSDEVPERFAQLLSQLEKAAPAPKKD
jgi:hypothetical protein